MFDSYARHYDLFNSKKPYRKEIDFIYKWAGRPKWIFDIGPGSGIYWKYYPKNTCLFGVDKSGAWKMQDGPFRRIVHADITNYRHKLAKLDCATALFDVLNYIPRHDWWKNIPIKRGGYFIFDIWDKRKVDKEGFRETVRTVDGIMRIISPTKYDGKKVDLEIQIFRYEDLSYTERHRMYIWSVEDIIKFAREGRFDVVEIKQTKTWQTWFKLRRK